MLQAVGGSQAADRKARAAGVWEAQRACDVPKFTESRGPGFRWSLSDSKSYRSAFHGSRSSKGEPRGLCLRHGGGGLQGWRAGRSPLRMNLGTMWATMGCPTLTTACPAGAALSSVESRPSPLYRWRN